MYFSYCSYSVNRKYYYEKMVFRVLSVWETDKGFKIDEINFVMRLLPDKIMFIQTE